MVVYSHSTQIYHIEQNEKLDSDSNSRKSSMNELILPAHAKIETRQYKPMQFEGSLGRLTSSSVHKPRQVSESIKRSVLLVYINLPMSILSDIQAVMIRAGSYGERDG